MTSHVRHRRQLTAGLLPPNLPMEPGELALNLPDLQLFTTTGGTPQAMLGVRLWMATAYYPANALVAHGGIIYKALVSNGPVSPFNPANWTDIGNVPLDGHLAALDPHPQYATDVDLSTAMASHLAALDPHPQYTTDLEVTAVMDAHLAAVDPHPQYTTSAELTAAIDAAAASVAATYLPLAGGTLDGPSLPLLRINGSASAFAGALPLNTYLHIVGAPANPARAVIDAFGSNAVFQGRRANGTPALPTAPLLNEALTSFGASGYGGAAWETAFRGGMFINASENWAVGAQGSNLTFVTAQIGQTNATEKMRLTDAGNLGIGITTPEATLHVASNNGAGSGSLSLSGTASASFIKMGNKNGGGVAGPLVLLSSNRTLQIGAGDSHTAPGGGTLTPYAIFNDVGVGIGNTAPDAKLLVAGSLVGFTPALPPGTLVHVVGAEAAPSRVTVDAINNLPVFHGRRSGGTLAGPTAVALNDTLVAFGGGGHNGTAFTTDLLGAMFVRASQPWTALANGTYLAWTTTAAGAVAATERMRLDSAGQLGINGAAGNALVELLSPNSRAGAMLNVRTTLNHMAMGFGIMNFNGYPYLHMNTRQNGGTDDNATYDLANFAMRLRMDSGTYQFQTAPSGAAGAPITFTTRYTINNLGFVDITTGSGHLTMAGHPTRFESDPFPVPTTDLVHSVPHTGDHAADFVLLVARCIAPDLAYSVGDECVLNGRVSGGANRYAQVGSGLTDAYLIYTAPAASPPMVLHKTTGAFSAANPASWELVLRCFWL